MPRRTSGSASKRRASQEHSARAASPGPDVTSDASASSSAAARPETEPSLLHRKPVAQTAAPAPPGEAPEPETLELHRGPYGGPRDWVEPDDIDGSRGFASISQGEITMVLLCLITGLAIVTIAIWYQRAREMGLF